MRDEHVVVDASALLDLLVTHHIGPRLESRLQGCSLHAPGHVDAQVFSGLGRLEQTGFLTAAAASRFVDTLAAAPIERRSVADLLAGAWRRRNDLPLSDALYVELASTLGVKLVTTNAELARASPVAELVALRSRPDSSGPP
jgi:predicted nucleic acid-binding protein